MAPSLEKVVKSCQDDEERLQNVQQPKLNALNCWRSLGDSPLVLSVDDLIKHLDKATYCKRTRNLDIKSSKSPRILELRCRRVQLQRLPVRMVEGRVFLHGVPLLPIGKMIAQWFGSLLYFILVDQYINSNCEFNPQSEFFSPWHVCKGNCPAGSVFVDGACVKSARGTCGGGQGQSRGLWTCPDCLGDMC